MLGYREYLKGSLEAYFDIEENYELGREKFDLFATFNQRNAKYMLLKNVEVYAFTSNEYIFHKKIDREITSDDLTWIKDFIRDNLDQIVNKDDEHMSSVLTFILEGPMPDEKTKKRIEKFKYYKSFSLGLKGWVNTKIMLIDPVQKDGITNKLGRPDLQRFIMN
ncbi:hypothetical protein EZV73_16005 [Acidaminobacter sp. JC074]|uniref:hypothetical protein n=1 Tax=Acidaminobacter sp. JC074 TaxID=2530199 RepID=UPI001F10D682|nr:hypothetical protein [Acidaminobacter sp. JC074]MCH4889100.1 hypothetical protein [Acidaminobacter sp. JC074]